MNLSFNTGDIIMYDINHHSDEDYINGGTH
jgi:hypothetical protein